MKKILFLAIALVMSVSSVWADHLFKTSPAPVGGEFQKGTTFYYLAQHHSSKFYLSTASGYVDGSNLKLTNSTKPTDNYGQWAIVGDDTNGYQFYNRGEGTSKVLTFTGSTSVNTGGDARFTMTETTSDPNSYFKCKTGGNGGYSDAEYFYLGDNCVWNKRGNYLAFWNDSGAFGKDDGSCTMIEVAGFIPLYDLEGIALNHSTLNMNIGQVQAMTVTPTPSEASAIVTWSSTNADVARVVDGKIQAISEGTATITATSSVDPTKTATCEVTVTKQDWYTHVSPELGKKDNDRVINTIGINGVNITVPAYAYPYVDLTAQKFTVEAGASLQASFNNIVWMHSMVYLNKNTDNQFTEDEMVTHSTLTGGNGTNAGIAAFTAPTTPGTYRMRFKTDWHGNNANGNDPAGRIGDDGSLTGGNSIWANRGVIIDVMLEVTEPAANPLTFTTSIVDGATYAIVNVQPASINRYLKNVEGTLTPTDASSCDGNYEWEEDAQFVAEVQADGRVAFKNVGNNQYLAYVNHEPSKCENGGKGFVAEVADWSAWTLGSVSTRAGYENTYYPTVSKRYSGYTGDASTLLITAAGTWNGWGSTECTTAGYSNNYGFVLVKEAPIVKANRFYRLKSKLCGEERTTNGATHTFGYIDAAAISKDGRNFAFNGYGEISNASFSQVFQFVPNGDKYYLSAQGSYMSKLMDGNVGCTTNTDDAALFSITAESDYFYLIDSKQTTNNCKYAQVSDWWGFGIGGWNPANDDNKNRCLWQFEEVQTITVPLTTVGEMNYATLYAPYAVLLPSEVEAYAINSADGNYLIAEKLEGNLVPKATAVVLVSETLTEAALTLTNSNETYTKTNVLGGNYRSAARGEGTTYVFSAVEGAAGFYKFGGATLKANKAYYVPTEEQQVQGFVIDFGGVTTGIKGLPAVAPAKASFDLQGRRINKATRGLFIQNGVKVIR